MRKSVSRRHLLFGAASTAVLAACHQGTGNPETQATPSAEPIAPEKTAPLLKSPSRLAAEAYALGIFKRPGGSRPDSWREVKQRLAFAFALSEESDRVVLEDGQGIDGLLGSRDYPDRLRSLTDLNRRLYIRAAMGQTQTLAPEQASLLTQLFSQGAMRDQNTLLLNSLVLTLVMQQKGLHTPPQGLVDSLIYQLAQNQSKDEGWGHLAGSQEIYTAPNVDNNVMALLAGIAPRSLLNSGRMEKGWRHSVTGPDQESEISVVSTALAGWVTPWSQPNWDFITSLQNPDGGFPSYKGDGESNPVATAEVLTLLAAPSNQVFGSFAAKTS